MAIVDASVLMVLLYQTEPSHLASRRWLGQALTSGETIATPVIALAEVAAAMGRGKSDPTRAKQFAKLITQGGIVALYSVTLVMAERAAEIAADYQIRGCDAVYVALAEQLGEALVTLDSQQLTRSTAVVPVRRP